MKKLLILSLFLAPFLSFASIDQNLKYRMSGQEVSEFQDYLISKGFLTGNSTGFFGLLTLSGTKSYQTSVGLPSTGYVGVLTREKVNTDIANEVSSSDEAENQETGSVTTLTSCKNGDLFNLNTGKSCSALASSTIQLINQVKVLNDKIDNLTAQNAPAVGAPAPVFLPPTSLSLGTKQCIVEKFVVGQSPDPAYSTSTFYALNVSSPGDTQKIEYNFTSGSNGKGNRLYLYGLSLGDYYQYGQDFKAHVDDLAGVALDSKSTKREINYNFKALNSSGNKIAELNGVLNITDEDICK